MIEAPTSSYTGSSAFTSSITSSGRAPGPAEKLWRRRLVVSGARAAATGSIRAGVSVKRGRNLDHGRRPPRSLALPARVGEREDLPARLGLDELEGVHAAVAPALAQPELVVGVI